jgi:hypothetical protein
MLVIELPPTESGSALLQFPAQLPKAEPKPAAPSPSSGYIIAVG